MGGVTQKCFADLVDWFAVMDAGLAQYLDEHDEGVAQDGYDRHDGAER